jgi:SAM-dependent methyltransferase
MIAEARRRHPEGDFRVGRAHQLPFPDGSFDIVVGSAVLHHIPDDHLEGALREITRVLDEHGRLIGREPNQNPFGHEAGWFSGAIMSFRHLMFRLTRSREYPEPELGDHHHPFDPESFLEQVGRELGVTQVEQRFPFSHYLLRVRSETVAQFARMLDVRLHDRRGAMFYYRADKNYVDAAEVQRVTDLARSERAITDAEFLAYLHEAAARFEKVFGERPARR